MSGNLPRAQASPFPELLDRLRRGKPEELPDAAGQLLALMVAGLPDVLQKTAIDDVKWTQPFATNGWWRGVWERLGVVNVVDLGRVGETLARTRGVGRTKLIALVQDLMTLGHPPRPTVRAGNRHRRIVDEIRELLEEVESGPPTPRAHSAQHLFRAVVDALPAELRASRLTSLPWSSEWCYTTRLWSDLQIATVEELADEAIELTRARGIGRGKVATIARELIFFCPELHARIFPDVESSPQSGRAGSSREKSQSLLAAVDRLAEQFSDRERDVLRRRIGWGYEAKPETLRTLAEAHGVTQERIRQIENQVRKRLIRLLQLRKTAALLREAIRSRKAPTSFESVLEAGPAELRGLLTVWKPLASLLEGEGGPYLFQDHRQGSRIFLSANPPGYRKPGLDTAPELLLRRSR